MVIFFFSDVRLREEMSEKNKGSHLSSVIKLVVCFHSGDAVPKLSSTDVSSDEPRLLLYLNKEISTSLQTGEKEWFKFISSKQD